MNTISQIGVFLLGLIASWKAPTNVENDLADLVLATETAASITKSPVALAIAKKVNAVPATIDNLKTGQLAQAFTYSESFDGVEDKCLVFIVRQYEGQVAPAGTPAEALKTMNGY